MEEKKTRRIAEECQWPLEVDLMYKKRLPELVDRIMDNVRDEKAIRHLDATAMPSKAAVISLLEDLESVIFPGYVGRAEVESANLVYYIGEKVNKIFDELSVQIMRVIRHECSRADDGVCRHCIERSQDVTMEFMHRIPKVRSLLATDVRAAYDGDPAAKSFDEIIFAYPGVRAITVFRIAHELWAMGIPILPRIMTEYAHAVTGIDIHPGATIGESFFIDHGTGVVIGETTEIGRHVAIYQGVTLGALRPTQKVNGELDRTSKRHPTIGDGVTIYSGATILGGETVIGDGAIIGGNVWLTHSVPPGTRVMMEPPKTAFRTRREKEDEETLDYSI